MILDAKYFFLQKRQIGLFILGFWHVVDRFANELVFAPLLLDGRFAGREKLDFREHVLFRRFWSHGNEAVALGRTVFFIKHAQIVSVFEHLTSDGAELAVFGE